MNSSSVKISGSGLKATVVPVPCALPRSWSSGCASGKPGATRAVFNHTYTSSGSYIFGVTVTDGNGLRDYASCVFSWFKPYVGTIPNIPGLTPPSYTIPDYSDPYPPGGYNGAGCPRDQWVNGYFRKDGTYVDGYYRNSPTDGCGGG